MSNSDQARMAAHRQKTIDSSLMSKLRRELAEIGAAGLYLLSDEEVLRLTLGRYAPAGVVDLRSDLPQVKPQPAQLTPKPLLAAPTAQITLELAKEYAFTITSFFEGRAKSVDYQALADNSDGQATSFGVLQWNFGKNTLGPLLKKMLAKNAKAFAHCFGADADYDTLKKALDENNQMNQVNWACDLQKKNKKAWSAAFTALGAVDEFNKIQREEAFAKTPADVMEQIRTLRGIRSDLMSSVEFRSYAALFDLCNQQGSLHPRDEIKMRVKEKKPATQLDLLKIAVYVTGKHATGFKKDKKGNKISVVSDCISRRMGILTGGAYESTENKVTTKRFNPNYVLIIQHGTEQVAGL